MRDCKVAPRGTESRSSVRSQVELRENIFKLTFEQSEKLVFSDFAWGDAEVTESTHAHSYI